MKSEKATVSYCFSLMLNIELKLIMSMRERPEEWVRVWFPLRPHVADLGHEGRRGSREKCRRGSYKK